MHFELSNRKHLKNESNFQTRYKKCELVATNKINKQNKYASKLPTKTI